MVSTAHHVDAVTGGENCHNLAARLLLACKAGQLQVVMSLLESGRAWPDGEGWTPLTSVEVEGNSGDWHYWRERACDYDPTPLHEAASRGNVEIVKALLAAGARRSPRASMPKCLLLSSAQQQPHVSTQHDEAARGVTPLHLAAQQGQAEVVRVLAEAGANVNILGGSLAEPPLHLATRHGHTAAMLSLLHKGADINGGNCRNQTALHEARSAPALDLLLASGADRNGQASTCAKPLRLFDTPLGVLVVTTHVRLTSESEAKVATNLVEVLLRHGARASVSLAAPPPSHHQQQQGGALDSLKLGGATTPERSPCPELYPAVSSATSTTASDWSPATSGAWESLSEAEADSAEDQHQAPRGRCSPSSESAECFWTPESMWVRPSSSPKSLLPRAAKNGVPNIVAALLRAGLDPTEADDDEHRMTPLHHAAEGGHPEVIRLLLRAGAEVDSATPRERRTSLHVACRCARLGCVLELLRWGANLNALCVLSEDDFGLESEDDDFYRTPSQVVGWADSSAAADQGADEKHKIEARHDAIRRALVREDRWRRRGGVVVLRHLLKKRNNNNPRDDGPTQGNNAPAALSRGDYSSDDAGIIIPPVPYLDSDGAPWVDERDAKRVCPTTCTLSGEEEGGKRQKPSVMISAVVVKQDEDEDEDEGSTSDDAGDKTTLHHALDALMRLGRTKEFIFRKVVEFL